MTLRTKLLLAQAPMAIMLAAVGVVSVTVTTRLGTATRLILADNYRSVLAAQRMKDSLERIDSNLLYVLAGHPGGAAQAIASNRDIFERELRVQEGNITERGERELTAQLRGSWDRYQRDVVFFQALADHGARNRAYFDVLQPEFTRIKQRADEVLALNQDAMVRQSDRAGDTADRFERLVLVAVLLGAILGLLGSAWLLARLLRPLAVVSAAVRRFGEGDLGARAVVHGADEIAAVAGEFNRMAERLAQYRASSLGELIQAQQAAQATIDALPDPVVMLDATGQPPGANAAASRLLGVDPERPGEEVFARVDPGVRAAIERVKAHVLGGKGPYVPDGFEGAVRVANTPEGERIFIPRAQPLYGASRVVTGAVVIVQDVTRLFRFDQLRNDLVATVAHEFRTPLTSLRMALHLCTEQVVGPLTAKQADLLFAAREDCDRLQNIVDELLNLARIEAGRVDLHKRRAEPGSLVEGVLESHRATAQQAGVAIRAEVLPGLPEVFVDAERLQLVFGNLVTNAIRHSASGGEITVRARGAPAAPGGRPAVRFEVVDRGAGIAKDHQAGLFEKFFRVPGSPEGGSGLGLFIAKGVVQAHGGDIGVDSVPGQGASFWFTVPVAPSV